MLQTRVLPKISLSMKDPLAQLGMAELQSHGTHSHTFGGGESGSQNYLAGLVVAQAGGQDDGLLVYGSQVYVVVWNQKDQMNIVPVENEFDEIDEIAAVLGGMLVQLVQ